MSHLERIISSWRTSRQLRELRRQERAERGEVSWPWLRWLGQVIIASILLRLLWIAGRALWLLLFAAVGSYLALSVDWSKYTGGHQASAGVTSGRTR